jgi:hypothetical protein
MEETDAKRRAVNGRKIGCLVVLAVVIIAVLLWLRSKRNSDTNLEGHPAVKVETDKCLINKLQFHQYKAS